MKIKVKTVNGHTIRIPAPMFIITSPLLFGQFVIRLSKNYMDENTIEMIKHIDLRALRHALKDLKYTNKGLVIVDIQNNDGTEVKITI
jgi:hypothetical protein